jgi:5-methylcytosine-specific restriction endonuclease McrA
MKSEEDKFWDTFSKYIRLRDSDDNGYCTCISCDNVAYYKECDAGHFISRNRKIVKFNEYNVNAQCQRCNRFENGAQYRYSISLDKKYGEGTAEFLSNLSHTAVKVSQEEYKELNKAYKIKVKSLLKEKKL